MKEFNAKKIAIDVIQNLSDNVDMEEIIYRLYIVEKVRKGREDITNGRVISTEELLREIQSW